MDSNKNTSIPQRILPPFVRNVIVQCRLWWRRHICPATRHIRDQHQAFWLCSL